MANVGERIRRARRAVGISQDELGKRCGWESPQSRISAYEKGRNKPDYEDLQVIAKVLGVDPSMLAFGSSSVTNSAKHSDNMLGDSKGSYLIPGLQSWEDKEELAKDEVEVAHFTEVPTDGGLGSKVIMDRKGAVLRVKAEKLRELGIPPDYAATGTIRGDEMDHIMPDGTLVIINTADTHISDGKLYAIDHGGLFQVRYLRRIPGGGVRISTNNPSNPDKNPDITISGEDTFMLKILGRVKTYSVIL